MMSALVDASYANLGVPTVQESPWFVARLAGGPCAWGRMGERRVCKLVTMFTFFPIDQIVQILS